MSNGKILIRTCSNQQRWTLSHKRVFVIGEVLVVMETEVWDSMIDALCSLLFLTLHSLSSLETLGPFTSPDPTLQVVLTLFSFHAVFTLDDLIHHPGKPSSKCGIPKSASPPQLQIYVLPASLTSPPTFLIACWTPPSQTAWKLSHS